MRVPTPVRMPAGLAVAAFLAVAGCASSPDPDPAAGPEGQASASSGHYQPGAPGESGQSLESTGPGALGLLPHTEDDVHFMQMMIVHHAQALEMTALVPERTTREDIHRLAGRIEASQADEIALMERWLERRGESTPQVDLPDARHAHGDHHAGGHHADPGSVDHGQMDHDHSDMPGMLSPEQLEELAAAHGEEFDRLFLEFMIFHHEGAVHMVHDLFRSPAGGQDGEIFGFASHVESDQRIEIDRMRGMLRSGS
jgi:uncharacterized protein (DUF305 family)